MFPCFYMHLTNRSKIDSKKIDSKKIESKVGAGECADLIIVK